MRSAAGASEEYSGYVLTGIPSVSMRENRLRSLPAGTAPAGSSYGVRAAISHWWLRNEPPNAAWKKLSAMTYFGAPGLFR